MPLPIPFSWTEDENTLNFVLQARGVKAKSVDIALCDVYVKVNCLTSLFEADLKGEIDPDHVKTRCRVSQDKVTLTLRKREPGLWHEFRAEGTKPELRERRQQALATMAERETSRLERREELKQDKIKAGEHEQWRLDRENREQIETWEAEEKKKWEQDMYDTFDEDGMAAERPAEAQAHSRRAGDDGEEPQEPVVEDLDDLDAPDAAEGTAAPPPRTTTIQLAKSKKDPAPIPDDEEEYQHDVRENPGKVGIRFTERPRPGVPVRDRGDMRAPPHPKNKVTSELPPMVKGDEQYDEFDPVWLKDKGDKLMVDGDYQGAHNAYTAALKLATNARCFANRAVASMFLGNLEHCLEDGAMAIRILDQRSKVPEGTIGFSKDPQDEMVRARCQVRLGTAYLWKGAFGKAEEHFDKALECEEGLDFEMRQRVKGDLERVRKARAALVAKEKADAAASRARDQEGLESAIGLYEEAVSLDADSAVLYANRCHAKLRAGKLQECLADSELVLQALRRWPTARRAPKKPERPAGLEPPFIDDPTFKHPDEQKQGEESVDWLMKHGGGTWKDLPSLPPDYEWVKDAAEKADDSWIAIRKKMPKATQDAIRRATVNLQDVLYTRKPSIIREHIERAIDLNKQGEGPSNKAIRQSTEYAEKLEEHEKSREAREKEEEAELRQELEQDDLEDQMADNRSGVANSGFGHGHPVESSRRRLFVKVLLRRARAFELLGDLDAALGEIRSALRAEPANPEARQRSKGLQAAQLAARQAEEQAANPQPEGPEPAPAAASTAAPRKAFDAAAAAPPQPRGESEDPAAARLGKASSKAKGAAEDDELSDEEVDHGSTEQLLTAAAQYMKKNDYEGALQMYNYARRTCKAWPSPELELKMMSNRSLCLQRLRGRLPELVSACDEALKKIEQIRARGDGTVSEETLLHMQCACLSRRGSAHMQLQHTEQGNADAMLVRELLASAGKRDSGNPPPRAG